MALFNSKNTKSLAEVDIDNSLFQLNDMDEGASFNEMGKSIESNINFAERINLFTQQEAQNYRDRLNKIRSDRERRQREELVTKSRSNEVDTSKDFVRDKREQERVTIAPKSDYIASPPRKEHSSMERDR